MAPAMTNNVVAMEVPPNEMMDERPSGEGAPLLRKRRDGAARGAVSISLLVSPAVEEADEDDDMRQRMRAYVSVNNMRKTLKLYLFSSIRLPRVLGPCVDECSQETWRAPRPRSARAKV